MSLLERVNQAAAPVVQEQSEEEIFLELRKQVNTQLSDGTLPVFEEGNKVRAENEIRSACVRVFAECAELAVPTDVQEQLTARFLDSVFGFGPLSSLLDDETVTEIMVNGPSEIYYERDGVLHKSEERFANAEQVHALIDRIVGPLGRRVDESSPMVNARLPQGHRVNVVLEALALGGPVVTIRKFSSHVITLEEMRASGSVESSLIPFLTWCIRGRKNVAVSGGTGSGKTTFLNALSCFIPREERIITIEDSAELRFDQETHVVRLEARPQNAEGLGEVTIRDLVVNALRMRPDRIVVGECRGAEAFDMLQAMNTGHDGSLTTLHANSTKEAILRLAMMVRYGVDIPVDVIESYIASGLDLVIQTERGLDGRRFVSEISELYFDDEARRCEVRPLYRRLSAGVDGVWLAQPSFLDVLVQRGSASREEVDQWLEQQFS